MKYMISDEEVRHLADLSSLTMNDEELAARKADVEQILGYVDQLSGLDTENVEPTYSVDGLETVWREDKVIDYGVTGDDLLALRDDSKDHMIKVPKVL
jgi:aspartyl-tRNA(Asn)/glutamyl-tRNA(Gln) amidotransferase subunit C